ncbi:FGGY-family carbohydrate kinase [Amphibacillus jilinensis]|uniref:FGGY-family carbohydrate kinase n=1 Tax=Amphibacillus jilinensis TaxID=1216008 RepID=UPI00030DF455|nr:glycerol kinase GlpK [Amphibacillus jilinensis]
MKTYTIIIDQSTAGTKLLLMNQQANIVDKLFKKHQQHYPNQGWVEHNPEEIIENIYQLFDAMLIKHHLTPKAIKSIGITNQRETVVVWDKVTGQSLYPALVWQCNRTTERCLSLIDNGYEALIKDKTGLKVNPYFSATKLEWIITKGGVKPNANTLAGTIDSWIVWHLTNGNVHATDISNASRTMLFNINTRVWDKQLLTLFQIPNHILPVVKDSHDDYGDYRGIPIKSVVGDSQAALYGHDCQKIGTVKATFGTGCSVLMQVGQTPPPANDALMTSVGWKIGDDISYTLEGTIRSSGDTLNWLKDSLQLFSDYQEATDAAFAIPDNEGVYLVPAFLGLGSPYWDTEARAVISGLTRNASRSHVLRAGFESIAYQVKDIIDTLAKIENISTLKVDGGVSKNPQVMQFLADILNISVVTTDIEELSALGAARLTGDIQDFKWTMREHYTPSLTKAKRVALYHGWQEAVKKVLT